MTSSENNFIIDTSSHCPFITIGFFEKDLYLAEDPSPTKEELEIMAPVFHSERQNRRKQIVNRINEWSQKPGAQNIFVCPKDAEHCYTLSLRDLRLPINISLVDFVEKVDGRDYHRYCIETGLIDIKFFIDGEELYLPLDEEESADILDEILKIFGEDIFYERSACKF